MTEGAVQTVVASKRRFRGSYICDIVVRRYLSPILIGSHDLESPGSAFGLRPDSEMCSNAQITVFVMSTS